MNQVNGSGWREVGQVDPLQLVDARLQLHWAVQPVMAFADCELEKMPDDSQSNLGWRGDFEAMVGRPRPDGLAAGLRIADLTLMVFSKEGAIAEAVSLEGCTIDQAVSWLGTAVTKLIGAMPEHPIWIRDYEMPEHPLSTGAVFALDRPPAFAELAQWFANGNLALQGLVSRDEGWAEVRCWPHHFDLGTLISIESAGDPSKGRSIGAGLSPGDHWYPEPYFYVNPYGLVEAPVDGPPLASGGRWHTDGWFGAVLTATTILENKEDAQESEVLSFLQSAVDAAREFLPG